MKKILLALSAVISIGANAQQVNFKSHYYFDQIDFVVKSLARDLNNDGTADIVCRGDNGINVLLNFSAKPAQLLTYSGRQALGTPLLGDFDGDGFSDIGVVSDSVYVFLNSGTGHFRTPHAITSVGPGVNYAISGDFNHDSKVDIATTNFVTGNIAVYPGIAGGKLGTPASYSAGAVIKIDYADMNNDGYDDIISLNIDAGQFGVLLNKKDGTFLSQVNYTTVAHPISFAILDVDGDGLNDIAIGSSQTAFGLAIYKNQSTNFSLLSTYPVMLDLATLEFLAAGDFDNNGKKDLAYIDQSKGKLNIMLNKGSANFDTPVSHSISGQLTTVTLGDFNNDGKTDIAVGSNAKVNLGLNQGNAVFKFTAAGAGYPGGIASGDFNKDGSIDLAVTNINDSTVSVLLNNQTGRFPTRVSYRTGRNPSLVSVADLVGDAQLDLLVASSEADSLVLLKGKGDGTFAFYQRIYCNSHSPTGLEIADFNADGKPDIVVLGSGTVTLLINAGVGFVSSDISQKMIIPSLIASRDLNGDSLPDLIVSGLRGYISTNIYLMQNAGNGSFGSPKLLTPGSSDDIRKVVTGDFNFDGIDDIGYTTYEGDFIILPNDGKGNFGWMKYDTQLFTPTQVLPGDFNGDGKQDLVFGGWSTGYISVALANGAGGYMNPVQFRYSGYLAVGNYDHDNKDDIALASWPYHYLTILIALPTLQFHVDDATREYGDANPIFTWTVTGWDKPTAPDVSVTCDATLKSPVGTYSIRPVISDSVALNYAVLSNVGTLTVTKSPLTITVFDTIRKVGMENPNFRVKVEGVKNNDAIGYMISTEAVRTSPPGYYFVAPYFPSGKPDNYAVTLIEGTLTIIPESTLPPYPNPSMGEFFILSLREMEYKIFDAQGALVSEGKLRAALNRIEITSGAGVYLIRLEDGTTRKVMILK